MKNLIIAFIAMICLISCKKKTTQILRLPRSNDSLLIVNGSFVLYNISNSIDSGTILVQLDSIDPDGEFYVMVTTHKFPNYVDSFKLVSGANRYSIYVPFQTQDIESASVYIISHKYNYYLIDTLN